MVTFPNCVTAHPPFKMASITKYRNFFDYLVLLYFKSTFLLAYSVKYFFQPIYTYRWKITWKSFSSLRWKPSDDKKWMQYWYFIYFFSLLLTFTNKYMLFKSIIHVYNTFSILWLRQTSYLDGHLSKLCDSTSSIQDGIHY
jgi:hypothetical protein